MKLAIQHVIAESVKDYRMIRDKRERWISNWQCQVVLAVSQIMWTKSIEEAFKSDGKKGLDGFFKKCQT